jgi:hypothetical protein
MKSNILEYILTGAKFLIGILGIIFFVRILLYSDALDGLNVVDQERYDVLWGQIGAAYTLTIIAAVICAAAWVIFGLFKIVTDIKGSMSVLIGIVAFAIIGFISWSMSNGELTKVGDKIEITENASHWSGAGLQMLYILLGITVLVALFTEVKKLIR